MDSGAIVHKKVSGTKGVSMILGKLMKGFIFPAALLGAAVFSPGCAGEDQQFQQLSRQQAATIESLNSEIVRLNEEVDDTVQAQEALKKAKEQLVKQLADEIASGDLTVTMEKRGLVVRFPENALFEPERVELQNSALATLDKITNVLTGELPENKVLLEGHTDDALPANSGWRSSWEYTSALPAEVLHYFVDARGLDPARFAIVSCAEYQRLDPRDADDGCERNRRVEIVVTPQKIEKESVKND